MVQMVVLTNVPKGDAIFYRIWVRRSAAKPCRASAINLVVPLLRKCPFEMTTNATLDVIAACLLGLFSIAKTLLDSDRLESMQLACLGQQDHFLKVMRRRAGGRRKCIQLLLLHNILPKLETD